MSQVAGLTRLLVICGPTAAGKSQLGLELAERFGGEIISCDSIAVYRGCDIGAAKPTAAEQARIPHHLLDVAAPDEPFTAARYAALADQAIAQVTARRRVALVVGGSGLYLRALLDGLFAAPPPDPALRARFEESARQLGWPALHAQLAVIDPAAAARIHPGDSVRVARALEVFAQTGQPISALQAAAAAAPRYDARVAVLEPPPAILEARIAARARAMVEHGILDETARLVAACGRSLKPLGAVGYKEALACLDGRLPRSRLEEAIRLATRHFARRQRTWFRKQPGTRITDPERLRGEDLRRFLEGVP